MSISGSMLQVLTQPQIPILANNLSKKLVGFCLCVLDSNRLISYTAKFLFTEPNDLQLRLYCVEVYALELLVLVHVLPFFVDKTLFL